MGNVALWRKNPFWGTYTRQEQIRIIRAKLTRELFNNGRQPTFIQRRLMAAATVLILELHEAEEEFREGGNLPKSYGTRLSRLNSILAKLQPPSKHAGCSPSPAESGPDLSSIIGGSR